MAKSNSTAEQTATDIAPDFDRRDQMDKRVKQLRALLASMYGAGFEAFDSLLPEVKDSLLWLAADLADEIGVLLESDAEVTLVCG